MMADLDLDSVVGLMYGLGLGAGLLPQV